MCVRNVRFRFFTPSKHDQALCGNFEAEKRVNMGRWKMWTLLRVFESDSPYLVFAFGSQSCRGGKHEQQEWSMQRRENLFPALCTLQSASSHRTEGPLNSLSRSANKTHNAPLSTWETKSIRSNEVFDSFGWENLEDNGTLSPFRTDLPHEASQILTMADSIMHSSKLFTHRQLFLSCKFTYC